MKGSSSETKMKYLSLALFAQRTTRALISFKRTGNMEPVRKSLDDAIASLNQLNAGGTGHARAFTYYEQVRTLQEIKQPTEEIVGVLRSIIEGRAADVDKALHFFHELEKQALIDSERPAERIPSGIRRLWQAKTT